MSRKTWRVFLERLWAMVAKARHFLHVVAARLLYYSGLLSFVSIVRRNVLRQKEIYVIGLHRVLTQAERERSNSLDGMVLTDCTFRKLLEHLQQRFEVISLQDLLTGASQEGGKPLCLITFDDGWSDTSTVAHPLLKRFGMPAVVFIATGSIAGRHGFWVERVKEAWQVPSSRDRIKSAVNQLTLSETRQVTELEEAVERLKRMPAEKLNSILSQMLPLTENSDGPKSVDSMMTWNQVEELSRDGMEIGAHTVSHPLLTFEDDSTVECELRVSKQTLEERLGKPVRAFAYPNGDWDERVRGWVERAGYECAFVTKPGWHQPGTDPYAIRRILLHEGNITGHEGRFSPSMLSLTLAGWS
jgi:peptidoglycan/xylan/chitin deacetylase (PgdA/CDA1 family)